MLDFLINKFMAYKKLKLRIATSEQERHDVYRFRYKIYQKEMGIIAINTDYNQQLIFDELDADPDLTVLTIVNEENEILGTLRYGNWNIKKAPESVIEHYGLESLLQYNNIRIADIGTTMLDTRLRGKYWLLIFALKMLESFSTENKFPDLILCNSLPSLIPHYLKLGFSILANKHIDYIDGIRITLAVCPYEKKQLKKLGFIFNYILSKIMNTKTIVNQRQEQLNIVNNFLSIIEKKAIMIPNKKYFPDKYYDKILNEQQKEMLKKILLKKELKHFASMIIKVTTGQVLIGAGVKDLEIFYIMEGEFGVVIDGAEIVKIQAGSFLGEFGLLSASHKRTANVVALSPSVLISLRGYKILKALQTSKNPLAKLLFLVNINLANKIINS